MASVQDLPISRKACLLFFLFVFLVIILLLFNCVYWPRIESCVFVDPLVCLKGQKYKKYNNWWLGRGFKLNKPQKVKAPFAGDFFYSPSGVMNYKNMFVGETGVLVFKSENFGMVKLYVGEIRNLKGEVAVWREVEEKEVVAEVLPQRIEFLDNYSAVEIIMPK